MNHAKLAKRFRVEKPDRFRLRDFDPSETAGFTAFLSGLRNRLAKSGVRVVTVKPGFVRTRMTRGLRLPPLLTGEPSEVGQAVYAAAQGGGDVVYVRKIWRLVMAVIAAIPEPVFKRLNL